MHGRTALAAIRAGAQAVAVVGFDTGHADIEALVRADQAQSPEAVAVPLDRGAPAQGWTSGLGHPTSLGHAAPAGSSAAGRRATSKAVRLPPP